MNRPAWLAVGALGVMAVMTQLALMREMLCAFSGNELGLGIILAFYRNKETVNIDEMSLMRW